MSDPTWMDQSYYASVPHSEGSFCLFLKIGSHFFDFFAVKLIFSKLGTIGSELDFYAKS